MNTLRKNFSVLALSTVLSSLLTGEAYAAEKDKKGASAPAPTPAPSPSGPPAMGGAEEVNVESIKQKYWARGDESELGVVQNRQYSKAKKWAITPYVGSVTSDPFLSVRALGGQVGYNFSEYFSVHAMYLHYLTDTSATLDGLNNAIRARNGSPLIPPNNETRSYVGTEAQASLLYGKLSLLGKAIIYYDLYALAGVGVTQTENGSSFTPSLGVGQQIYLNKWSALRFDYRVLRFNEDLLFKNFPGAAATPGFTEGQYVGDRVNWSHTLTLGVSFFFGI